MIVVSILNQKGGVGKTTIAVNLAAAFQKDGYKVLLVYSDPQGSTRDWHEANEGSVLPVVEIDRDATMEKDLVAVAGNYDLAIIDGAPQIAKLSTAAVKISDLVIIPCQPSPFDIWTTADLVEIIRARQQITDGSPKAAFLISRMMVGTKLSNEVRDALKGYDLPVLKATTSQRVAYPTTAANGSTVLVGDSNCVAKKEIVAIKNEILEILNDTPAKKSVRRVNPQLKSSIDNVTEERTQWLNIDIAVSKHQALKILAARKQTTIRQIITELIDELIDG